MPKFMHLADTHMDYQQYGIRQREEDGYAAFGAMVDLAIREQVNVLLVAGDFFHSKDIRARAWLRVRDFLGRLKRHNITVIMVEGNHDRALFGQDETWVETLHIENLALVLGSVGEMEQVPFQGVRVVGFPYLGHKEAEALDLVRLFLDQSEPMTTILLCHIGVSEVMGGMVPGGLSLAEIKARLHPSIKYVATGHYHRSWIGDMVHCPGTIFPNKVDEPYGGAFIFEADALGVRDIRYVGIEDIHNTRPILRPHADNLDQVALMSKCWEGAIVQLTYTGTESRETIETVFSANPLKFMVSYKVAGQEQEPEDYQSASTTELESALLTEVLGEHGDLAMQLMNYALAGQDLHVMVDLVKEKVGIAHAG